MKALPSLLLMASTCCLAQPKTDVSGTYELLVCKKSCSFEKPQAAIAHGTVVLFESPLSQADADRLDPFHFAEPNEVIRACFVGEESNDAQSFAFGEKVGTTAWSLKGNTLTFSLMRSLDAGYSVEAERNGTKFSGKGVSWGAGVAAPGYTPDAIVGRRVGPPNIAACTKKATQPAT